MCMMPVVATNATTMMENSDSGFTFYYMVSIMKSTPVCLLDPLDNPAATCF